MRREPVAIDNSSANSIPLGLSAISVPPCMHGGSWRTRRAIKPLHVESKRTSTSVINGLTERVDFPRQPKASLRLCISSNRHGHEVLAEDVFQRIFCWERKKVERSGRHILLMLVYVESVLLSNQSERTLSEIASALSRATRETDIAGWYREGAILGVIFTEFGNGNWEAMQDSALTKVITSLRAKLSPEQVDGIHISFHFFPEKWDKTIRSRLANAKFYPDLFERDEARKVSRVVKRLIDIVGSIAALLLCSPLLLIIALAIKLSSKGPILFKQERVGRYGLPFTFLKFRSMECANDPRIHQEYVRRFIAGEVDSTGNGNNQNVVYKIQEDPRVTRVGKFLRRTSMDELPQFINVLRGEMSLVGPRPPIPYELETYQIWHRRRVLEAKPGITGLWQVNGRSRLKFDDMVRLDLQYAKTWSLWLDIKILLRTPRAVLFGSGAY
jgi:lipopolysaccharide/colanic/teichoic acid biosynthesis glycosyltransferase